MSDFTLLTIPAAARLLGISLETMRALVRDGRVPAVRLRAQVRVPLAALAVLTGAGAP